MIVCENFLKSKDIDSLVISIKSNFDENKFNLIVDNTKRIYFDRVESYFHKKNTFYFLDKNIIMNEYKSFIYKTILTFNPKKSCFTTYLYNMTHYMLYSLNTNEFEENQKKKSISHYFYENKSEDETLKSIFKNDEYSVLNESVKKCIERFHDKRIKKIIDIRFNKYENKNAPWKEVSEEVGCTHQYCHFLFGQFLNSLKRELKRINYVCA